MCFQSSALHTGSQTIVKLLQSSYKKRYMGWWAVCIPLSLWNSTWHVWHVIKSNSNRVICVAPLTLRLRAHRSREFVNLTPWNLYWAFFDSFIIFLVWQMCLLRPHSSIVLYVHVLDTFHICSFACCSGKDISDYTVYVWQLWQHISGENTCIICLIQSYVLAVVLHLFASVYVGR